MADYFFSDLIGETHETIENFDPAADRLIFNAAGLPATELGLGDFSVSPGVMNTTWTIVAGPFAGHTITLTGDVEARNMSSGNVQFYNGGKWLLGDDAVGTADDDADNTLIGTDYADAF